jgi:hypothetical protein
VETGEASVAKRVVPRAPAEECYELIPITRHTLTSTLTNFAMMLSEDLTKT